MTRAHDAAPQPRVSAAHYISGPQGSPRSSAQQQGVQMVLPVLQRRVVGKRMKPEGWCCVVALLFVFWPCACIPCFLDQCQEDVVVEEYIMVRRARACAGVPCGAARQAMRRTARRAPWHASC